MTLAETTPTIAAHNSDQTPLSLVSKDWENWSGTATCSPETFVSPATQAELQQTIAASTGQLRVRGTGHSFTNLCTTNDTLISLENMQGDVLENTSTDKESILRLQAGASLNTLSKALLAQGFGFKNLGDIDVQSLAGAAMTATHGTGENFPCLAGEIRSLKMITATGETVEASASNNSDLLEAGRVSMGALGVLTEAEVAVRPAFKLHRTVQTRKLPELMADAHNLWAENRNFEFFVLPFCDYGVAVIHNETSEPDLDNGENDDEAALAQLKMVRNLTKRMPWLRRKLLNAAAKSIKDEERVGASFDMLASVRDTKFHEMEYHLPVDRGIEVLAEVIALIERERAEVFFPIEVRKTAADTGWLSPFEGAPRISVAVHVDQASQYDWFFSRLEPIFRRNGGRPHWGKLHSLESDSLRDLYPRFGDFQKLRAELDPKGRLINAHLGKIFDVVPG